MKKLVFYLLILSVVFLSCNSRQRLLNEIKAKEAQLWADSSKFQMNNEVAKQIVDLYEKFANANPEDSIAPEYLFKEAEVSRALKQFDKSISIWQNISEKYPTFQKAPHCLFLQGFVYENDLKNIDKAREKYNLFLEKYPAHELSDDVKFSLQNLGKSPEDIIKEFEQKQKQDSVAVRS